MVSSPRRVVVTGVGLITPLGIGLSENWEALIQGQSGIQKIQKFDASIFSSQIAGEVKVFDVSKYFSLKEARRMDLYCQYGVAAAKLALDDAGFQIDPNTAERVGVIVGSGIGGIASLQNTYKSFLEKGKKGIGPFFIPQAISNMAAGHISILFGAKGPNTCIVSACSTGAHAIGESFRLIQHGKTDVMISGGAEAAICELGVGGFAAMRALSTRNDAPEKASRPFDKDRDGFVISEGAGILILEELTHAKNRGAKIYAELVGYGLNADAYHMTNPSPSGEGAARCMQLTLEDAGLEPKQIGYVNAHGTSTEAGDVAETEAIKKVFGAYAKNGLSVSSTKSMTGHLLGAAGSVEAAYTALALQNQKIPPTINLENQDERCDLDYTANVAKEKSFEYAISNSFGFGGTNAGLVFKRWQ